MSYRNKIQSLLSESVKSFLGELYSLPNYTQFQAKKVIPMLAHAVGVSPEEFLKNPNVTAYLKAFKDATVERFGVDEKGRPNTSVQDDPRWDLSNPESDSLAKELTARVLELTKK
jgi:hypothetical protein